MYLKAKVLNVEIIKNRAFHEKTGKPHPSYFLEASVVDTDTQTMYRCSFRKSLGAEQLLQAYHQNIPEAERDTIAADVVAKAKQQIEGQEVTLVVEGIEFMKLLASYFPLEEAKI